MLFAETGTFLAYDWFLSNTAINQRLHALNGNGGSRSKGAGKGKGKAVDAPSTVDAERDFLDAVKASMPEAAKLRAQSTLIPEEWNVEVVPYQYMTSKGGVCIAPKTAIPDILNAVGYTAHPSAIIVVQDPDELGLHAYPRSLVTCSLSVSSQGGSGSSSTSHVGLFNSALVPRLSVWLKEMRFMLPHI